MKFYWNNKFFLILKINSISIEYNRKGKEKKKTKKKIELNIFINGNNFYFFY